MGGNIVEGESCDGIHRPLDYDGNGGVVNDACGVIILKRVFDALADGDKFLAHVSASSTVNVGHRSQFTEISASSMKIACTNALTRHPLHPCASFPEYFELSGTGLPFVDEIQMRVISELAERHGATTLVGSASGTCGNTENVSGIVNIIRSVLSLNHQQVFATTNCKNPIITTVAEVGTAKRRALKSAGILSYGLGGTASALIISKDFSPAQNSARRHSVF